MARYGASQTKACALLRISRSLYNYRSRARDARALVQRIKEIAATRVHYGYRRVHVLLRREGWRDNCKRVYRLYRLEACRYGINGRGAIARRGCGNRSSRSAQSTKRGAPISSPMRCLTAGACVHSPWWTTTRVSAWP
jgi:transposase InsO family protein